MKDELILVLDEGDRNPEFNRRARLALRNPARVFLEDREDLLLVRNRLIPQQTALDLVDLAPGMRDKALDGFTGACRNPLVPKRVDGRARPLDQSTAALQIRLNPLRTALRPARGTHPVEQFPDLPRQMAPLAPTANRMLHRHPTRLPNQTPHRVPQQVHVRRVVHVRLHHERVTPPAQWLARLFFCDLVAALHHQLSHRRQQTRRQQRHVVPNRLTLVIRLVAKVAVPQERPHLLVMVRKVVKTVEVAARPCLRTPNTRIGHKAIPGRPTVWSTSG